jgi:hypothetical protein
MRAWSTVWSWNRARRFDIKLLVRWFGSYSVSINNSTEQKISIPSHPDWYYSRLYRYGLTG